MISFISKFLLIATLILVQYSNGNAQIDSIIQKAETKLSNIINPNQDTILQKSIRPVLITEKSNKRTDLEEEAYQKLKRKVIKLYPYALLAKQIHENTTASINSMESNKEKRKFRKEKEKELRDRFENEIKALYTSDGPILVKLIHRETSKTTYDLLKESKSWVNCIVYQMAAKSNGYSLKETYDPLIDKDIENVVTILKSEGQLPVYSPI